LAIDAGESSVPYKSKAIRILAMMIVIIVPERGRLYIAAWNPILSDTRTFDSGSQTGSRIASPIASPTATSLDNIFTRHNVSVPELKGQLPSPDPIDIIPFVGSRSPRHRVPR
jgi:hypothetical protein